MKREIIQTGNTVDEAIETACMLLGKKLEDCQWEIMELPKTSFFGLKKVLAKVKVWIEVPDEVMDKPEKIKEVQKSHKPAKEPAKKAVKQEQPPKPVASKPVVEVNTQIEQKAVVAAPVDIPEEHHEKAREAEEYVKNILDALSLEADIERSWEDGGLYISIVGKSLGVLIGRKGETLNALQYLTGLSINRGEGEYLRITVDCGDYIKKRDDKIIDMARKAADQVIRTDISKKLIPMTAAERRIVHATISEIEGVSSASVGTDPHRKVIIKTPTSKNKDFSSDKRPPRRGNTSDRKKYNNNYNKEKLSAETVSTESTVQEDKEPQKVGGAPLYGKIDL